MKLQKLLIAALLSLPAHSTVRPVPVMIETNGELDACSLGQVSGITTFLAVRTGPGTSHSQVDSLHTGDFVLVCDGSPDNQWVGVVYTPSRKESDDCGASDHPLGAHPYQGSCASGWVRGKWVTVVAG